MLSVFLLPVITRLGHESQVRLSPRDGMHVCTDHGLYSHPSCRGMESEPMLTPRGKSPPPEKFSSEEDRTQDAASNRTASPTHYQRAIPAPDPGSNHAFPVGLFHRPVGHLTSIMIMIIAFKGTNRDFFFFTISSLRREPSPPRTLKWPERNRTT